MLISPVTVTGSWQLPFCDWLKFIFIHSSRENGDSLFPFLTFSFPCHLCNCLAAKCAGSRCASPCFSALWYCLHWFYRLFLFFSVEREESGKSSSVAAVKVFQGPPMAWYLAYEKIKKLKWCCSPPRRLPFLGRVLLPANSSLAHRCWNGEESTWQQWGEVLVDVMAVVKPAGKIPSLSKSFCLRDN